MEKFYEEIKELGKQFDQILASLNKGVESANAKVAEANEKWNWDDCDTRLYSNIRYNSRER